MKLKIGKKIQIAIMLIFLGAGIYLVMSKDNVDKNEEISNVEINKNEINLASRGAGNLEYNEMENDYKEIERLDSILNNKYLILINKDNKLDEKYVPNNLKVSEAKFLDYVQDNNLESKTSDAAKKMFEDAAKDGISLVGVSGYRSYGVQKGLYNTRIKQKGEARTKAYTAEPGASEHQSGLALDILCDSYQTLDEGFENTDAFTWLTNNCYKYGFILRYLKGKEDITGYNYEPWHFRYIGNEEIAEDIMNSGLAFEEYINEIRNKIEVLKDKTNIKN
ncbi:M15 family metallopeptidase [Clostridium sp. D53t1_180928_C8]|uniref:M15 family metallopeptidase n=1 Tax=Clostridium sp. D53t1_180928_C8 TaxID=2787101 RepID=UPI0018AB7DE0|nr:M15 family metallopeptidase [Clostridium sp. D53t1_180928_C8]